MNTIWNTDAIAGMAASLSENSIDLCVTSIPFGSLFTYTHTPEDLGNNTDGIDMRASMFGLHYRFFATQLLRVMKQGCNVCIHIQQLLRYLNEHGNIGRRDFRGALIDLMESSGFHWKGEVAIPKNPQSLAKRLNLHSLMFATGKRNARDLAPAVNDYILIFQKPGMCAVPVPALRDAQANPDGWVSTEEWIRDAHGVWSWDDPKGARMAHVHGLGQAAAENARIEGYEEAQAWLEEHDWLASGIWANIQEMDVLDVRGSKGQDEEKHVCPLQLEVIRRLIRLYTNPGEVVLDPFMGIGSTAWVAIEQGRQYAGFELKASYYQQALRNCAEAQRRQAEMELPLFAWEGRHGVS